MKKRILFAVLGVLIVIAVLAGVKVLQSGACLSTGRSPFSLRTREPPLRPARIPGDLPVVRRLTDRGPGGHGGRRVPGRSWRSPSQPDEGEEGAPLIRQDRRAGEAPNSPASKPR